MAKIIIPCTLTGRIDVNIWMAPLLFRAARKVRALPRPGTQACTKVPLYPCTRPSTPYLSASSVDDAVLSVIDGLWGEKCPSMSRASELNKHIPRREPLWLSELDLLDES